MNNFSRLKIIFFNFAPELILIYYINLRNTYAIRVRKVKKNVYSIKSQNQRLFISRRYRLFKYKKGIIDRFIELRMKYFIDYIEFHEDDLVIDCGSNIGEVPLSIRQQGYKIKVIAIEPDPIEFKVLKMNLFRDDTILNFFLGPKSTSSYVQFDNDSGDTHVITNNNEINRENSIVPAKIFALDDLLETKNITAIKLVKIEVEGYEPEVLFGMQKTLKFTKYVTIDTGPERSLKDTFDECNLFLTAQGFVMIKNNDRKSALFVNLALWDVF